MPVVGIQGKRSPLRRLLLEARVVVTCRGQVTTGPWFEIGWWSSEQRATEALYATDNYANPSEAESRAIYLVGFDYEVEVRRVSADTPRGAALPEPVE